MVIPQTDFEEMAQNWLTAHRRKVAPKTTGRRLTSLRSFAKWAGWGDVLDDYSAPSAAKSNPHPLPEGIEGVYRLIETTNNDKQKALIALCGLCGCRIGEALSVRPSDFDLEGAVTLTIRGKGDKTRIVPVSAKAWDILQTQVVRAFVNGNAPVVGLNDRFARRVITELGAKARLKRKIASHDLRATFATAVHDNTLDIRLVQELLGHSSVDTTQIYTMVKQGKMREAVEGL